MYRPPLSVYRQCFGEVYEQLGLNVDGDTTYGYVYRPPLCVWRQCFGEVYEQLGLNVDGDTTYGYVYHPPLCVCVEIRRTDTCIVHPSVYRQCFAVLNK